MTDIEIKQDVNLKRKHETENDSEDELFIKFENERKKRISDEHVEKSKDDDKNKQNNSDKTSIKETTTEEKENKPAVKTELDKLKSQTDKITSSPSANKGTPNKMIQGKLNFFKKAESSPSTPKPAANNTPASNIIDTPRPIIRNDGEWEIQDFMYCEEWRRLLKDEFGKKYFSDINNFIREGYKKGINRPPKELVFNAFNSTRLSDIKVVIIGQDPYHDDGQAHGLAFSVPKGIALPPSLRNIFTELKNDIPNFERDEKLGGCLQKWTRDGVFLLNTFLTVEAHKAGSHSKIGWDIFTDSVIKLISAKNDGCAFLLWGNFAQKKESLIDKKKHHVIKCAHPSPFSCTRFYGSRCFSKANDYLRSIGKTPINWSLKE